MNSNDVKKYQDGSALRKLSLKDLQRVRGAIQDDLLNGDYHKIIS